MQTFTVSELTYAIKKILEGSFRGISVKGEISNFKRQTSGHLYFQLKDADAQISAVLFRGNTSGLTRLPKDGDQVIVKGEMGLYAPRGQYQIIVRELEFLGVGELLLQFHQLKEKLEKQGLFSKEHKKPLPKFPRTIGVITSPTGAVIQDIIHVLSRRFAGLKILLNPVKVQGEGAALEIATAIEAMNRHQLADILIVGRGGGSIEDLWAFNEEIVARAIFASNIPVISAVGHETDVTIADWVADVRAPTPSAAAEIAIGEKANLLKFLNQADTFSCQWLTGQVEEKKKYLGALARHPMLSSPDTLLAYFFQRLDAARSLLEQLKPSARLDLYRQTLSNFQESFTRVLSHQMQNRQESLKRVSEHLNAIHPKNLLQKGYSILFSEKEDSIILSAKELTPKKSFSALLHDGTIKAVVQEVS